MNETLFTAGGSILAALLVALITWGPTILVFNRKRQRRETVRPRHLAAFMIAELAGVIAIVTLAEAFGLLNPGSYLLAIALLVGAAGAQAFSSMRFKSDGRT